MTCDVSVVVPAYHGSGSLGRALASVFGQSARPREIIVVDDGSDDWEQTRDLVAAYASCRGTRWIRLERNRGPSAARNAGIAAARFRYLAFLDADDIWHPEKLAIQYGVMRRYGLAFSSHDYVEDVQQRAAAPWPRPDEREPSVVPLSAWRLLFRNRATPTVMVVKEKMKAFDESLRRCEDFQCWMEVVAQDVRSSHIRRSLAGGFKRGLGESGLSRDVSGMHAGRMQALRNLRQQQTIGLAQYAAGIVQESLKYPLRLFFVARGRDNSHRDNPPEI